MEPEVSELVVPAEFDTDVAVGLEEVPLERQKERKSGRQLSDTILYLSR